MLQRIIIFDSWEKCCDRFLLCLYIMWVYPERQKLLNKTSERLFMWQYHRSSKRLILIYSIKSVSINRFSICDTCDKRQKVLLNKDRSSSLVRTILHLRSSPVGEWCFAGAAVVSGQQSVRTFSTSRESCFVDKVLIWKSFT